jgi:hypothetical protein
MPFFITFIALKRPEYKGFRRNVRKGGILNPIVANPNIYWANDINLNANSIFS